MKCRVHLDEGDGGKLRPLATAEARVVLAGVFLTLVSLAVAFAAPYTVGALILPFPLLALVVCTIIVPDLFIRSWKEEVASALIPLLAWLVLQPVGALLYFLISPVAAFFGAVGGWLGGKVSVITGWPSGLGVSLSSGLAE